MAGNAQRYLDLISQHLQEHHAALLVGSGFSRNATKVNPDVPDIPLWDDLTKIFKHKLNPTQEKSNEFDGADPLALAEHVEIAYGRSELDRLLLTNIRDSDYQPSQLYRTLLQLPWSDIFTTNYDTLLERASEELTEQAFSVITSKDDLIGSSGTTRIIKLHGSFPSHRPFIITSEDYRTYPHKFAPFVNTVQQSLLENTLCMVGFSGDDPNFNNWIGWIRDNLGAENAPHMYLLVHRAPSDTRREWLRRRNIIPVDLSEIFHETSVSAIYEKAFEYLVEQHRRFYETRQKWEPESPTPKHSAHLLPIKDALPILRKNHETCPNCLVLTGSQLDYLRSIVISPASQILSAHCSMESPDTSDELEYLYEYDWLRGKALLPLFASDLKSYQLILCRHTDDHSTHKLSIQLSVLRTFRECGGWAEWDELHQELLSEFSNFTQDQHHQFRWEECLCSLSRYQFQDLKKQLETWTVPPNLTIWVLRKAGLWAEYGECEQAHTILQQAILDIRRRLVYQKKPDLSLLSLESAMMHLQGFISQARKDSSTMAEGSDGNQKENAFIDAQHRALHEQFHVSWDERNAYFVPRLEATWEPFQPHQVKATFDFGRTSSSTRFQEDRDRILAFSFLRFREETGIPFRIRNVYSDTKAACGAAERLALFVPYWSILTLVRSDEPKAVGNALTRGVLSSWAPEDADQRCQFYLDAVLRTEAELTVEDWFYRNSFARLAANVLPEVLSELCSKCSIGMLHKLFDLLKQLYASPKRLCYQQTVSLTKRFFAACPDSTIQALLPQLVCFPLNMQDKDLISRYFPDPFQFIPTPSDCSKQDAPTPLPEIQTFLTSPLHDSNRNSILDRLLHCFYHGLLTAPQKITLRDLLWENGKLQLPLGWPRTVCLDLPAPPNVDVNRYLSAHITENIEGYSGSGVRAHNDEAILFELTNFAFKNADAFTPEEMSLILTSFSQRIVSLSQNLSQTDDFMGIKSLSVSQIYNILHALWVLSVNKKTWIPTSDDQQTMTDILDICEQVKIHHPGLKSIWNSLLGRPFSGEKELERCLRSTDDQCSYHSYDILANALHYPSHTLLSTSEIQAGVAVMAQQIAWCIPKQLEAALQAATIAAKHQPSFLIGDTVELVLTGLSQLREQTVITEDDSVESASKKGSIRKSATALAKALYHANLEGDHPEILEEWLKIIQDSNEFAEIRNVQ